MPVMGKPDTYFVPLPIQDIGTGHGKTIHLKITQIADLFIHRLFRFNFKPEPVIEPIGVINPDNSIG